MGQLVSGKEDALLAALRALARRGALLERHAPGGGVVRATKGRADLELRAADVMSLIQRGLIREAPGGTFTLSKSGASHLKAMLNRKAAAAGTSTARPGARADRAVVNEAESPLGWLRRRGMIADIEFDAGERLRTDFTTAQMMPRVTSAWDPARPAGGKQRGAGGGSALEISDRALAARLRVEAALKAVGPELSGILVDVCCFLHGLERAESSAGWPKRSGKVVLQLALATLARHYGLAAGHGATRRAGIRHWGTADFRPRIDAPDAVEEGDHASHSGDV